MFLLLSPPPAISYNVTQILYESIKTVLKRDKPFDSAETLDSHRKFEHNEPGHSKPVAGVG